MCVCMCVCVKWTTQLPQIFVEVEIKRAEGHSHTLRLLADHYPVTSSCLALPPSNHFSPPQAEEGGKKKTACGKLPLPNICAMANKLEKCEQFSVLLSTFPPVMCSRILQAEFSHFVRLVLLHHKKIWQIDVQWHVSGKVEKQNWVIYGNITRSCSLVALVASRTLL